MEETEKAIKNSEYKNWTTLEDLLGREGFVFHDKSTDKYEVSNCGQTKSRKRTRIIYKIEKKQLFVLVLQVGHRQGVYK